MSSLRVLRRPSVLAALALMLGIGLVWGVTAAHAAQPRSLDQRTYDVASQLQCPVCNGESVADASSEVALEMRSVVRQKLAGGESEQQVLDYFRHNYTDAILETPPKQGFTWLIWIAPWAMFVAALLLFYSVGREWRRDRGSPVARPTAEVAASTLTADERARYRALLQDELDRDEGYRKGGD
ncbi:MAG: cytochrome c-type biogenesis protein [Ktedonobacterales bacterium]